MTISFTQEAGKNKKGEGEVGDLAFPHEDQRIYGSGALSHEDIYYSSIFRLCVCVCVEKYTTQSENVAN